jgi:hypothetical protein
MTEEKEYELALAATQEMRRQRQNGMIGMNKYHLGIDDKLYNLTQPGLYFTEFSYDDVANKRVIHALSAI